MHRNPPQFAQGCMASKGKDRMLPKESGSGTQATNF